MKLPNSLALPPSLQELLSTELGLKLFAGSLQGDVFVHEVLDELVAEKWGDGVVDLPDLSAPCIPINLRESPHDLGFPAGSTAALY
ncbi:hypothetical protein HK096_005584, partial [Nowakowskiella sp. JEL0078]